MNLGDDDFTLFGLPHKQAVDRAALDARWRELQAQVHPDRHAHEGAAQQRLAIQRAMRVNQAYQRLKGPMQRGAYLCELRGVPIQAENNTAMPAAFLMQQMQWREALEEVDGLPAVEALEAEVLAFERGLQADLEADLDERADTAAAARTVRALMFVARFREDIARRQEALDV
jgi:molecular chaperone HscB